MGSSVSVRIPGNMVDTLSGTDPVAGVESTETVPTDEDWDFHGMVIQYVADATVANRDVDIIIDDGTNEFMRFQFNTSITASQTVNIHIGPFESGNIPADTSGDHYHILSTQNVIQMQAGWRVRTTTAGIVAGDDFGAPQIFRKRHAVGAE